MPRRARWCGRKKLGVLKQDQYEFDAYRVVDTVIMGNKALWAAMEEREVIYNKPEMTDEDGIAAGRAGRHCRR